MEKKGSENRAVMRFFFYRHRCPDGYSGGGTIGCFGDGWRTAIDEAPKESRNIGNSFMIKADADRYLGIFNKCPRGWRLSGVECVALDLEVKKEKIVEKQKKQLTQEEANKIFFDLASCPEGWVQKEMGCIKKAGI